VQKDKAMARKKSKYEGDKVKTRSTIRDQHKRREKERGKRILMLSSVGKRTSILDFGGGGRKSPIALYFMKNG